MAKGNNDPELKEVLPAFSGGYDKVFEGRLEEVRKSLNACVRGQQRGGGAGEELRGFAITLAVIRNGYAHLLVIRNETDSVQIEFPS